MVKNQETLEVNKIENLNLIIDLIRNNRDISRVKLASLTGFSRMNVTRLVGDLMDRGIVEEGGELSTRRGRPAKKLHLVADSINSLVINLDVNCMTMALVDLNNRLVLEEKVEAGQLKTMEDYLDKAYLVYEKWQEGNGEVLKRLKCISIVSPGIINPESGEIILSAQLGWRNIAIVDYAEKIFEKQVVLDNDVKAALLGELTLVEGDKTRVTAYLGIGYGLGAGLWTGRRLLRGAHNNAGEIGHISVDAGGKVCSCGRRGCLDTVLNIESFLDRARAGEPNLKELEDLTASYGEGRPWALELVDDASKYFSIAINNISFAYDPARIIIGGQLFERLPWLLEAFTNSQHYRDYVSHKDMIEILPCVRGSQANLIGGAFMGQLCSLESLFI